MTQDFTNTTFEPGFRFRGARIAGKDRVEIDLEGVGVADAVLVVDRTWTSAGLAVLVLGADPTSRNYSSLVHTGHTAFLRLASQMFGAQAQMLPAGASYDEIHEAADRIDAGRPPTPDRPG